MIIIIYHYDYHVYVTFLGGGTRGLGAAPKPIVYLTLGCVCVLEVLQRSALIAFRETGLTAAIRADSSNNVLMCIDKVIYPL